MKLKTKNMDSVTYNKLEYITSGSGLTSNELSEIVDLMDDYARTLVTEALRKHGVVRPEVESAKAGRTVGKRSVGKSRAGGFTGPTICPCCHATEEEGHETWCPELRG